MKLTAEQVQDAYKRADATMKEKRGHQYVTILKTRCQHCGRSPKQTGVCSGWFITYLDLLQQELTAIEL